MNSESTACLYKIGADELSLDSLVREYNRAHLAFRVHTTATKAEASSIEREIKAGRWPGGKPWLNLSP